MQTINLLEEKIKLIENIPKEKVQKTTSAQSEFADIQFCTVCEYPAEDLFDLGEHMCEFHSEGYENKISCHYCDDTFDTKDSLSFFLSLLYLNNHL